LIPNTLDEWDYEGIKQLVDKGYFETDTFDFKYKFKSLDHAYHESLVNTASAFANTRGGFMVFGVHRKKDGTYEIEGIEKNDNIAMEFGQQIGNANPTIDFVPKNPPIEIPGTNRVLPVFYIPQGINRPHMNESGKFYYRTNSGNELMSYEQIRVAFLRYEERRHKLRLLYTEIIYMKTVAESIKNASALDGSGNFSASLFDDTVIISLMPDIFPLIEKDQELVKLLFQIRSYLSAVNGRLRLIHAKASQPLINLNQIIGSNNVGVVQAIDNHILSTRAKIQQILEERYDMKTT
jgi:hypothetical protein